MLLSPWRCPACSLPASPTSMHLQNVAPAHPDSTRPNFCFHTGEHPLLCSLVVLDVAHLCPLMPLWAPSEALGVCRGVPGTDSHYLPGLHFIPYLNSLNSKSSMRPPLTSGATLKSPAEGGGKIKRRLTRGTRRKLLERNQRLSRDVCAILVFIGWHNITTYSSNALPSHTVQVERN